MKILALDLATKTGWAFYDPVLSVTYGTFDAHSKNDKTAGARFLRFEGFLSQFVRDLKPDEIFFESVARHQGVQAAHMYGAFKAVMYMVAEELSVPCFGVAVGTLKKHATGNGRADKAMMIKACNEWGYQPEDDNAADALALLRLAMHTKKIPFPTMNY
jgi:Holliday junction resolvasome RuvABC endonuclease subunit